MVMDAFATVADGVDIRLKLHSAHVESETTQPHVHVKMSHFLYNSGTTSLTETPTTVELRCGADITKLYGPYFGTYQVTHKALGDEWIFPKTDDAMMAALSSMVGEADIRSKFTLKELPAVASVKTLMDLMGLRGTTVASSTGATTMTGTDTYPRLLLVCPTNPKVVIVDYTVHSISIHCDKEWGTTHSDEMKKVGAKFNMNLTKDAARTEKTPGWIFFKSDAAAMAFVSKVAGVPDIMTLATPPPPRNEQRWKSRGATTGGSGTGGGTVLSGLVAAPARQPFDIMMNTLMTTLTGMTELKVCPVVHPAGLMCTAVYGPTALVVAHYEELEAAHGVLTTELEIVRGSCRAMVVSKPEAGF